MDTILTTFVAAVALGIAGQIIAERFQLPAIMPLLMLGVFFGPFGLALVHPEALGGALEALIHLGVAIILFEGGLSLDPQRLSRVGSAVGNLLTIGVAVTGVASAAAAHWTVGMPWTTAALFGAIVTVTGPTVIVPLLRHMIAPREVKTILLSEGLIVDPIGAILAYLVLQWIERAGIPLHTLTGEVVTLAATGVPFRDAYVLAATELREGRTIDWRYSDAEILQDLTLLDLAGFNLLRLFGARAPATDVVAEKILRIAGQYFPDMRFQLGLELKGLTSCSDPANDNNIGYLISNGIRNMIVALADASDFQHGLSLGHLVAGLILAFALLLGLNQLGLDVSLFADIIILAVAALFGSAAVAFGIGAADAVRNVMASHYVRKTYRNGLRVRVQGLEGEILEMTPVAVILETPEGEAMIPARHFLESASLVIEEQEPGRA